MNRKTIPSEAAIETLPGIGKVVGAVLRERGLCQVGDLPLILPRNYVDERQITPLSQLEEGKRQVSMGVVLGSRMIYARGRRMAEVSLAPLPSDPHGPHAVLRLVWFSAFPNHLKKYRHGAVVRVSGRIERYRGVLSAAHPDTAVLTDSEQADAAVITRYPDMQGVPSKALHKAIQASVNRCKDDILDAIPQSMRDEEGLMPLYDALVALHFPSNELSLDEVDALNSFSSIYHQRLAYEEFFLLELALHERRAAQGDYEAEALKGEPAKVKRLKSSLPFKLTSAQSRVLKEIITDLQRDAPMRRLLQGDVGCGKTAVAALASVYAVSAKTQVAIMAPTEVLAEQHYRSLKELLEPLDVRVELVLGGMRSKHKEELKQSLASGQIHVAVGTHALMNEDFVFKRLRFVVVDEQHRFGVSQRLSLVKKASPEGRLAPHLLVMTATPIPRSLALALYGDLQTSVVDEMPPGRLAPVTKMIPVAERHRAIDIIKRALNKGGQVFVVCPSIEVSEAMPLRAAEESYAELSRLFHKEGVGLMHGRLDYASRQQVMADFVEGKTQILVSTTVIEVGVDIPRANLMVIEHAERFGLAQLHQLRGRIGRGGQPSACLLLHEAQSEEAESRLEVMCESSDGFEIAEKDLQLRGPGELFGQRQSGVVGFRFGNLKRDAELLERARAAARKILESDPTLEQQAHRATLLALKRLKRASGLLVKEEAG
ncbi:MAG: ATP-dependent DNA helicase RecG [Myxococcales bacterium]|nr:MAG: ATP-dependent DNA helicase RecG [Myxococcales bacterium]